MKVTECLNVEHDVFLSQLDFLEKLIQQKASKEVLSAVARTIGHAVENHRQREEELLYPAIEEACGPNFMPLEVMEQEHQEIDRAIRTITAGAFNAVALRTFIDTLRAHIGKEVQVLFPLAEQRLPSAKLEALACRCACSK